MYRLCSDAFFLPSCLHFSTSCSCSIDPAARLVIIKLSARLKNRRGKGAVKGVSMKIKIEIDPSLTQDEVIIHCQRMDEHIVKLQQSIADMASARPEKGCIALKSGDTSYYIPLAQVLFFETEGKRIQAHTAKQLYVTELKLYELEECLPGCFMRISKSTIVNLDHIYSITKNLSAASTVEFYGTAKKVYVSRSYYKALIERLGEKRRQL